MQSIPSPHLPPLHTYRLIAGKSVLHLDSNDYYGSENAAFSLEDFIRYNEQHARGGGGGGGGKATGAEVGASTSTGSEISSSSSSCSGCGVGAPTSTFIRLNARPVAATCLAAVNSATAGASCVSR